jgi:hypothetical protein
VKPRFSGFDGLLDANPTATMLEIELASTSTLQTISLQQLERYLGGLR